MGTVGYFEKMSSLLPIRSEPSTGGQEPRVVDLEGEDAEQVFSALSSTTARRIVATLHEEPRTQSDIAEELDTTVQNVRYHLDKLEDAGLVEVVDTWYSSRGNEMQVFAPADGALIVSGDEGTASRLRSALSRLVGGVAVLGLASLLVQTLVQRFGRLGGAAGGSGFVERDGGQSDDKGVGLSNGTDYDYNSGEPVEEGAGSNVTEVPDEVEVDGTAAPAKTRADASTTAEPTDTAVEMTEEATSTARTTEGTTSTATETTEEPITTVAETATTEGTPTPTSATSTTTPTEVETVFETTAETTRPPATTAESATTATDAAREAVGNVTTTVDPTAAAGTADPGGVPPGMVFFLGGVSVLVVLTSVWYVAGR